ncbi:YNFM family putative membrane transporter [Archangium gephyra]|uniref:Major facilitator superfamily MFS_1 n=1 Tax=Archangium gephyra TaxID=48 RepID=A0AAC8QD94_9BACT|nr:MFS transporter [Archangium gephyra]AKJ05369.1 major facilitator superfamily MFS_1 [Archangium gephyra]REG36056.1 YNFM family putative membrane transporter [Archangium gephyra]
MDSEAPGASGRQDGTLALYFGTVAAYADMYLTQPILPLLSREFGVGPARAGFTVSAVVLAIAAASSFYGPLSDVLGRKRVMVGATLLRSVATLACAFTPSFGMLVGLRAAQGVLVPGMTAVVVAYAGDRYRTRRLAPVVAGIIAASVVGGLVGRVVGGWIAAHAGWRAAFVAFAFSSFTAAFVLARGLAPVPPSEHRGWLAAYRGMLVHLTDPPLLGAFLVGGSLFFGWIGLFTYLPYHLSAAPYELSTELVSSIYLVYLAGVVIAPVAGRLSARVSARRLMGIGLTVEALGMLAALARPLPVVVGGLVVLVLGTFTAQAVAPAFVNTTARSAKGSASALYLTFYYLGGTFGSVLPGLAWQAWGWTGVVACCAASVAVGLLANALLCGTQRP